MQLSSRFTKEILKTSRYSKFQDFHNLMSFRIRDILLVSSLYDSYIFEEDGRLYELIRQEYQGLSLSHSPELIQVSSGVDAIQMLSEEKRFDLVIVTLHIEDMSALNFAKKVRETGLDIPIVLLGYDNSEMTDLITNKDISIFDKVFIWQGDYRIILGIVKYLEDKYNVENDTKSVGVQSVILIEDNIRFYSSYLPIIYTELLKQSQSLISEGINLSHKFLRMRARPKILLCTNYEEAWKYFEKYEEFVLGVISDVDFERNGKPDSKAGILFAQQVKARQPDIPILLQSTVPENERLATKIGASFLLKDSPTLLEDLKKFMINNFGFGDFVFKTPDGNEVGRASNLTELEQMLKTVPDESILYHASRNHFSNWLKARTEFWLAHQLRPKKVSDFESTAALRQLLIDYLRDFRKARQIGVISDFNKDTFDPTTTFARIGGGSLGGKARGLGFVNNLLSNFDLRYKFKDVKIFVPSGVVIGTEIFDQFLDDNNLREYALRSKYDSELIDKFINAKKFPESVIENLTCFLEIVKEPIAVRSSSLLEDSQGQPFAGVYDTYMLPNNHHELKVRLKQLLNTIKRIYASVYFQKSKDYIRVTSYRLEEEKMAIIIQKVIGSEHNGKFYPEFSGVAKSYNFYPTPPLKSSDGIVSVALGLGKTIVEGGNTVRFCPKYPRHILQYSAIGDILNYTPKEFYAIDMSQNDLDEYYSDDLVTKKFDLMEAYEDGTLNIVGSTYSKDNHVIYDGVARAGTKLFTMAPLLKYNIFPLPQILDILLELGTWGTGSPVEIEFAVNLTVPEGKPKEFGLLQMRPLVISHEIEELELDSYSSKQLLCKSNQVLGHGIIDDIYDIVFVDKDLFERKNSNEVAHEISQFNSKLINENKPYLLIGLGRWGTMDPWLGIPVTWEQINGAKAIIESNFTDFNVTPSQGSHFFQNLTSFKIGYFTVDGFSEDGFIDWNWLKQQPVLENKKYTKHVRLKKALTIKINGHENKGIIVKP
ncbi:PEP/pyruvate-binding domain-containing protein [Melioribacteraceae bacterium 4301-Me]|uniref:PEP/pyruvate-binding domain-containing protein n=1 Tax=Pyranulibacter aquaticus TaxID=3163344 RepID=UPI0035991CE7